MGQTLDLQLTQGSAGGPSAALVASQEGQDGEDAPMLRGVRLQPELAEDDANLLRFTYDASFRDPATGRTIEFRTRQVVESTPSSVTFRGQGVFVRVPGEGAVLLDVGRLIIDPADGSTLFRSAKALALDDPTVAARYDAAICSLF